mgnify:CR=1 FL=1
MPGLAERGPAIWDRCQDEAAPVGIRAKSHMTDDSSPRAFRYDPPPPGKLPVIHVDEHILVIDKPAGLLTVSGKTPDLADCLDRRAQADFPTATIIHRLDKDTSGLIILALSRYAHGHIGKQFEKRQVRKRYVAAVWGQMAPETGRVDAPVRSDWPNRPKQRIDRAQGRSAVTDWRVIESGEAVSRVELTPLTGRTHQLRVHMAHLGHPILGDNLYAHDAALAASDRLCLHAAELCLRHPDGGAPVCFRSAVPF